MNYYARQNIVVLSGGIGHTHWAYSAVVSSILSSESDSQRPGFTHVCGTCGAMACFGSPQKREGFGASVVYNCSLVGFRSTPSR